MYSSILVLEWNGSRLQFHYVRGYRVPQVLAENAALLAQLSTELHEHWYEAR